VQPFDDEPENEITLTAFRLLTMDLLVLFHVSNEGTINILGESVDCCGYAGLISMQSIISNCQNRMRPVPSPYIASS
jgi:hypothetical protein